MSGYRHFSTVCVIRYVSIVKANKSSINLRQYRLNSERGNDFVFWLLYSSLLQSTKLWDWREVWTGVLEEWSSTAMAHGGRCVTRAGKGMKLQWPVTCWTVEQSINSQLLSLLSCIQMERSGIFGVTSVINICGSVKNWVTSHIYAKIQRLLEWSVLVSKYRFLLYVFFVVFLWVFMSSSDKK